MYREIHTKLKTKLDMLDRFTGAAFKFSSKSKIMSSRQVTWLCIFPTAKLEKVSFKMQQSWLEICKTKLYFQICLQ